MSTIKVYCRVRPHKRASRMYSIDTDTNLVHFEVPRDRQDGRDINHNIEDYKFKFDGIFDQKAAQHEVFEGIAKDIIANVIEGYNGTIFAYGQTGSGKTFTITGGPERYEDRGIIPRTIEAVFGLAEERKNVKTTVSISYLEIYNNNGFDLLDPSHEGKSIEDLPKVSIYENEEGRVHMSNLGQVPVASKEDALNLLFVGDTNRVICATPMNDQSSRSHCIFTLYVTTRPLGGENGKVKVSKLHLVDLAGSERTKKTKVNGKIFSEACHINLSLHFLEQVIVALQDKSKGRRSHVPYRNSMMTSVLKDSLGGNCKTCMIATCSPVREHIDESISTCKFAQRVASIKNQAIINEELDPKLLIRNLKQQVRELQEALTVARGDSELDAKRELTNEEKDRCLTAVRLFLSDERKPIDFAHPAKVRYCYGLLRKEVRTPGNYKTGDGEGAGDQRHIWKRPQSREGIPSKNVMKKSPRRSKHSEAEIEQLRYTIKERDHEIAILVSMLKGNSRASAREGKTREPEKEGNCIQTRIAEAEARAKIAVQQKARDSGEVLKKVTSGVALADEDKEALKQRQTAFDEFKASYSKTKV